MYFDLYPLAWCSLICTPIFDVLCLYPRCHWSVMTFYTGVSCSVAWESNAPWYILTRNSCLPCLVLFNSGVPYIAFYCHFSFNGDRLPDFSVDVYVFLKERSNSMFIFFCPFNASHASVCDVVSAACVVLWFPYTRHVILLRVLKLMRRPLFCPRSQSHYLVHSSTVSRLETDQRYLCCYIYIYIYIYHG